jgi:hypothetical protein
MTMALFDRITHHCDFWKRAMILTGSNSEKRRMKINNPATQPGNFGC